MKTIDCADPRMPMGGTRRWGWPCGRFTRQQTRSPKPIDARFGLEAAPHRDRRLRRRPAGSAVAVPLVGRGDASRVDSLVRRRPRYRLMAAVATLTAPCGDLSHSSLAKRRRNRRHVSILSSW